MKKSLVLLGFMISLQACSYAAVTPSTLLDIDNLREQGYSESTLQLTDQVHYKQESMEGTYTKYYTPKKAKNKLGAAYSALKKYVDCTQDDGIFGDHQINFTNTWTGELQDYMKLYEGKQPVNNL